MAGRRGGGGLGLWRSTAVAGLAALAGLPLLACPDEAGARERAAAAAGGVARVVAGEREAGRRLPASSAMPVGAERLPPAGYLDYCLRFRGVDRGCAL